MPNFRLQNKTGRPPQRLCTSRCVVHFPGRHSKFSPHSIERLDGKYFLTATKQDSQQAPLALATRSNVHARGRADSALRVMVKWLRRPPRVGNPTPRRVRSDVAQDLPCAAPHGPWEVYRRSAHAPAACLTAASGNSECSGHDGTDVVTFRSWPCAC